MVIASWRLIDQALTGGGSKVINVAVRPMQTPETGAWLFKRISTVEQPNLIPYYSFSYFKLEEEALVVSPIQHDLGEMLLRCVVLLKNVTPEI